MIKLLLKLLRNKRIKSDDKDLILNYLLERVNALPIKDLITFDPDGTVRVNGKNLTTEQTISLRESLVILEKNWAYKLIKEQIAFNAITIGIHKGNTLEQIMFPKAALWIQAQEIELITKLSGQAEVV